MTQRDDLDRQLSAWLDDPYTPPAPHYLGEVLERTRHTRQRPAWTNLERWIPMADKITRPAAAWPLRMAWLLLIALVLVVAATISGVGSRLLQSIAPVDGLERTIPQGGAAVLAFGSFVGGAGEPDAGDIYLVRADGTDLRQLTSGPGAETAPAFSPDGRRIAFRQWQDGNDLIVVIDAGGGNRTILATNSSSASYCTRGGLAWSPDASSLIFRVSSVCDSRFDLFIVATDGSAPATKLLAPGLDSVHAAWSPDGTRIALLGGEAAGGVGQYVVDVGPGRALSGGLTARRIGTSTGDLANSGASIQWSPDGTKLAVISEAGDVVVIEADGSGPRVVAETAFNPAWSPDGRQLGFHRTVDPSEYFAGRPCTARTWDVDADGTNERRLDPLAEGCSPAPSWSPDGTRIAGLWIVATPDDPNLAFHYGVVTVDGSSPLVALQDGGDGSWQPVVAPLPPAPLFPAASPSP